MTCTQKVFYRTDYGVTTDYEQAKEWVIEAITSELLWECSHCLTLFTSNPVSCKVCGWRYLDGEEAAKKAALMRNLNESAQ